MIAVKTVTQYKTVYTIFQVGNASFRIQYSGMNGVPQMVDNVFASVKECEEYISSPLCKVGDKMAASHV